jgi:peptidoglycan/xylan/chitin deacetylase (PgdA/CDA1 family)
MLKALRKRTARSIQGYYELRFLRGGSYPDFVYDGMVKDLGSQIPVFVLHAVSFKDLDEKLCHLVRNGYRTVAADQLLEGMENKEKASPKTVVLTFDDGHESLWSVAFPLLKKYGLVGVAFIVPTWLRDAEDQSEKGEGRAGLSASGGWNGAQRSTNHGFVTWQEVIAMHQSGVMDFQSHSLSHNMVFTSDTIKDFVNPALLRSSYDRIPVPTDDEVNGKSILPPLGMPIYTVAPRFTGARRYFDDEGLRKTCLLHVRERGGAAFFEKAFWRKELAGVAGRYKSVNGLEDRYESDEEREEAMMRELAGSKEIIEKRLHKSVKHLCHPFYSGSQLAVSLSSKCGYVSNYWGWPVPSSGFADRYGHDHLHTSCHLTDLSTGPILDGKRTNRPGDDPFKIVRLPGDYIFRLPGEGRKTLAQIMISKCMRNLRGSEKR